MPKDRFTWDAGSLDFGDAPETTAEPLTDEEREAALYLAVQAQAGGDEEAAAEIRAMLEEQPADLPPDDSGG
jgi:hypothetical protein